MENTETASSRHAQFHPQFFLYPFSTQSIPSGLGVTLRRNTHVHTCTRTHTVIHSLSISQHLYEPLVVTIKHDRNWYKMCAFGEKRFNGGRLLAEILRFCATTFAKIEVLFLRGNCILSASSDCHREHFLNSFTAIDCYRGQISTAPARVDSE